MERKLYVVLLLCLAKHASACPDGWLGHNSNCYFFSKDVENWPGAQSMCKLIGGQLVIIDDANESEYLSNNVRASRLTSWIALSDVIEEGVYHWFTEEGPDADMTFANWAPRQPNDGVGTQDCVIIGDNGGWWDQACSDLRHYICEQRQEQAVIG